MKTFTRALTILIFSAVATVATADAPVVLVDPNPGRFLVTQRDADAIADKYSEVFGVVQWWVDLLAQQKLANGITKIVADAVTEATPLVKWTGQSVLYEIRVFRAKDEMSGGWFIAQIAGEKAIYSGIGSTAEQALFANFRDDRWSAAAPEGYEVDPGYSGFFIVREVDGKVKAMLVPKGTLDGIVTRMRDTYGELETKFQAERMDNKDAWVRMANTARSQLGNAQAKALVDNAIATVLQSQAKVADITQRMKDAIDREQRTANALFILSALKTVVDATTLLQTAIAETKAPASQFANAKTADAILSRTNELHNDAMTIRTSTTLEFNTQKVDLDKALQIFSKAIEPAKPPKQTQELLQLGRLLY